MPSAQACDLIGIEAGHHEPDGLPSVPNGRGQFAKGLRQLDQQVAGSLHDLRNMLAVAFSGTNILRLPMEPPRRIDIIDAVQEALQCIERLTAKLAGLPGAGMAQRRWVDLSAVLARQAILYRCNLPGRIWLRIETSSKLPQVWLDQAMLEAALCNLVLNARDAMPEGGYLTIRAKKLSQRVRLLVADTGTGMDPDTLRRAGTAFFTRKPGSGMGLGLAQVRQFSTETGGGLAVRSRIGCGTVFVLDLPI